MKRTRSSAHASSHTVTYGEVFDTLPHELVREHIAHLVDLPSAFALKCTSRNFRALMCHVRFQHTPTRTTRRSFLWAAVGAGRHALVSWLYDTGSVDWRKNKIGELFIQACASGDYGMVNRIYGIVDAGRVQDPGDTWPLEEGLYGAAASGHATSLSLLCKLLNQDFRREPLARRAAWLLSGAVHGGQFERIIGDTHVMSYLLAHDYDYVEENWRVIDSLVNRYILNPTALNDTVFYGTCAPPTQWMGLLRWLAGIIHTIPHVSEHVVQPMGRPILFAVSAMRHRCPLSDVLSFGADLTGVLSTSPYVKGNWIGKWLLGGMTYETAHYLLVTLGIPIHGTHYGGLSKNPDKERILALLTK